MSLVLQVIMNQVHISTNRENVLGSLINYSYKNLFGSFESQRTTLVTCHYTLCIYFATPVGAMPMVRITCKQEYGLFLLSVKRVPVPAHHCSQELNVIHFLSAPYLHADFHKRKKECRPVVLFASEDWTLRKAEEEWLKVWKRKLLKKVYGRKKVNGQCERRSNKELEELYNQPDIAIMTAKQRLRWLGYI